MQAFTKLTPAKADISAYADAFAFVFAPGNEDIRNVAITGPYGSGKSSLLKAFSEDESFKEHKPLKVSLTHFNDVKRGNCKVDASEAQAEDGSAATWQADDDVSEREIEGQLLNQLIHLVDKGRVPKSRFTKTQQTGKAAIGCVLLIVAALAIALSIGFGPTVLTVGDGFIAVAIRTIARVTVLAIALCCIALLLRGRGIGRFVRKISFQGAEIEVFDKKTDSIFDRYMDDILYLLGNCGYNVIAFEDLDRFGSLDIFVKLREINRLLNEGRSDSCAIRFFYLVSDDMLSVEERVKFFDFVIPVRPYVDPANAEGTLMRELESRNVRLRRRMLADVALHVADARLMGNIVNEYLIYRSLFSRSSGEVSPDDDEKLFALVVYKNVYPGDFALLQTRRGYLHGVISSRDEIISLIDSSLRQELERLEIELADSDKEHLNSVIELNLLYTERRLLARASNGHYHLPSASGPSDAYDPEKLDELLRSNSAIGYTGQLENLGTDESYQARKRSIELKSQDARRLAEDQMSHIRLQLTQLNSLDFKDLIIRCDTAGHDPFAVSAAKGNEERGDAEKQPVCSRESIGGALRRDLVRVLVVNGYIDESYEHYMSAFRPDILSEADERFLRNASAVRPADPEQALDDPAEVLARLDEHRFGQRGTRNYSLTHALFESDDLAKRRAFIEQLSSDDGSRYLVSYTRSDYYSAAILADALRYWPDMVNDVFSTAAILDEDLREFAWTLLADAGLTREDQGRYAAMLSFIERDERFLCVHDDRANRMVKSIVALDALRVGSASPEGANLRLRRIVYEHGRYSPWMSTVCEMLIAECGESGVNFSNMLTRAHVHAEEPIGAFVRDCLSDILRSFLGSTPEQFDDSEQAVLWAINDVGIDADLVDAYIEALPESLIGRLGAVQNRELWPVIVRNGVVAATAENIMLYAESLGGSLDENAVQFMNEFGIVGMTPDAVEGRFKSNDKFADMLLAAEGLRPKLVAQMLADAETVIEELHQKDLPSELVDMLVTVGAIRMNAYNLDAVRTHYDFALISFIKQDLNAYGALLGDGEVGFSQGEMEELLELDDIAETQKVALVRAAGQPLIPYLTFGDEVCAVIVGEFLDERALKNLPSLYESGNARLRSAIDEAYVRRAFDGSPLGETMPSGSRLAIMQSDAITAEEKRVILAGHAGSMSRSDVVACLQASGNMELAEVVSGAVPSRKVVLAPGIRTLIDSLRSAGLCAGERAFGSDSVQLYSNAGQDVEEGDDC